MIDTKEYPLLAEHLEGSTLRAMGERHSLSAERMRQLLNIEKSKLIREIQRDLLLAAKYEQMGRDDEAEWPTILIPFGPGYRLALDLFGFITDTLKRHGFEHTVQQSPLAGGLVLQLHHDL